MKYFLFYIFFCSVIFSSCSQADRPDPRDYTVDISTWEGRHIGYGVIRDNITLMTVGHVYRECQYISCRYRERDGTNIELLGSTEVKKEKDIVFIGISPRDMLSPTLSEGEKGLSIYTLVFRSGSWQRIDGRIISLSGSYFGYDGAFSGILLTGALETDIVLSPGESGTPVWTLSGELVGVMSASDERGKKGWIVR